MEWRGSRQAPWSRISRLDYQRNAALWPALTVDWSRGQGDWFIFPIRASILHVNAGVIEGFFGKPWDWSSRHSNVDFLCESGYQFYIYAPKADPYLRRRWREPMPEQTLRHLSELSVHGAARGVSIGVGLTPFEIYLNYDADAQISLRSKVRQINESAC